MSRKLFLLPLLLMTLLIAVSSCKKDGGAAGGGASGPVDGGGAAVAGALPGQNGYVRYPVSFRWHVNYDWWSRSNPWGWDTISQYLNDKFNVTVTMTSPDALAAEVLNLMVMADDLPDVIWMERDATNIELSKMGIFVPVNNLVRMVGNNWYNDNVPAATQNHYAAATGGVNYVIPNWVRMGTFGVPGGATGGNDAWMYTTKAYAAVGSPPVSTFEDLYEYAVKIRDSGLTNAAGLPLIPLLFNTDGNYGQELIGSIFMSFGGTNGGWGGWESIRPDGTYGYSWENPIWRDAVMEANRWFRERLFPATMLTQSRAQFDELLLQGRFGLLRHDHSNDDGLNFRRIIGEQDPGNTVEIFTYDMGPRLVYFLPARGLRHQDILHQTHGTLGWNGSFITKNAKGPGRIFELLTYMLTPQGSIDWTLGPRGHLWSELDRNGYPILTTPPSALSSDERTKMGLWTWDLQGHANNVDNAKFAANSALPANQRNWVESMQQTVFSPNLMLSDEFQNMTAQIEGTSALGIQRTLIQNYFEEMLPQIITASTAAQAMTLFNQVVAFGNANGMQEINRIYDAHWRANCAMQGGSIFEGRW